MPEHDDALDAQVLRSAVVILRRRSKRPHSLWLDILIKVLNNAADSIEAARSR